jgi:hypothetical protein
MVNAEAVEQIKICEYLRQKTDLPFLHIPNGNASCATTGRLLKRMGVTAGVSDLFLPRGNKTFSGLWLEVKTLTGRASPSQLTFISKMIEEGYSAHVVYGADSAILIIKSFYGLE